MQNPNGDFLLHARRQFQSERERANRCSARPTKDICSILTLTVPPEATGIVVSADGQMQYSTQNSTRLATLGQLQMAKFVNPDGLLKLGENLYQKDRCFGR